MTTVFVGSYAPADRDGIHVFDLDAEGTFHPVTAHSGITNPSFLTLDAGGRHLFAVGETGLAADGVAGHVYSFRIERHRRVMQLVGVDRRSTGGDHPCHIAIDRSGGWLAVSNYSSGNVALLPVSSGGALENPVTLIQHSGEGPRADRQAGPHAHSAIFAPDNRFLIVADLGIDRLAVYHFDSASGACELAFEAAAPPGSGPRHMVIHPDGAHLFVVNELDNTLALWAYDGETGRLRIVGAMSTVPSPSTESLAADVHLSSSGRYVYVSNRGHDSIAQFAFDARDGLQRLATTSSGGAWPRGFGLAPDDRRIVVAHRHSDEIVALPLAVDGGELGPPSGRIRVFRPSCVVIR